jgi:hypothetical protein
MRRSVWKVYVTFGLLSATLLLGANSVVADNVGIVKLPQDIAFKGSAGGVQIAILYGDPAKLGLDVVRLKLPEGLGLYLTHTRKKCERSLCCRELFISGSANNGMKAS